MIHVFDYEGKDVIVECTDGKIYKGHVDWCVRAADSEDGEDMLGIDACLLLASEIKAVQIVDPANADSSDKTA